MFKRIIAFGLLGLCMLAQAAPSTITGHVDAIDGQRVTIVDTAGNRVTLTVPTASKLAPGQRVRVTYEPVGDTLRATAVVALP